MSVDPPLLPKPSSNDSAGNSNRYFELKVAFTGNLVTTLPLALMMVQGGAALDNAKKYVEEGKFGGVGSPAHAAAVVGDTVGDPLKDAAGASLDVLMNLIGSISILFASSFAAYALLVLV